MLILDINDYFSRASYLFFKDFLPFLIICFFLISSIRFTPPVTAVAALAKDGFGFDDFAMTSFLGVRSSGGGGPGGGGGGGAVVGPLVILIFSSLFLEDLTSSSILFIAINEEMQADLNELKSLHFSNFSIISSKLSLS